MTIRRSIWQNCIVRNSFFEQYNYGGDPYAARASREPQGLRSWLRLGGALGDTLRVADGISLMDGATTGATIAALLGIVYGSVLPMGPIRGGVLGILGGGFVGWALDLWVRQEHARKSEKARV